MAICPILSGNLTTPVPLEVSEAILPQTGGGGGGSVCLKYIKLNAYLALNGESETAFFASIKLSYSFALEEKIFIIIDYCLKCTVCNTSKIILTFGFFLLHSNTQHFHQFCPVIIHTDVCWFWLG